jgi:hypothetical protein
MSRAPGRHSKRRRAGPEESFGAAEMEDVQRVVLEKAKQGNMQAAAIAERIWRRRPARPVRVKLPPVNDASGLAAAQAQVIALAARGKITPQEGRAFAAMLDCRRRALDLEEYEAQLIEIEENNAERARQEAEKGK